MSTDLGRRVCCVGSDDCYIDTISNCSIPNSVPCKLLTPGTTQACCPPFTFCPSNFNQSAGDVRRNIIPSSQTSQISSSKSSSLSSLATIMSSTSSFSTTSSSLLGGSPTSLPNTSSAPSSKQLSAGADAGTGVGAAIAVLAFFGVGFWAYRRGERRGKGEEMERDMALNIRLPSGKDQDSAQLAYEPGFNQGLNYTKYELPGELSSG